MIIPRKGALLATAIVLAACSGNGGGSLPDKDGGTHDTTAVDSEPADAPGPDAIADGSHNDADGAAAADAFPSHDVPLDHGTPPAALRVPAEWEPHAATWLQWPGPYEKEMRPAFARVINVIRQYEPVHLLVGTKGDQKDASQFLQAQGVPQDNITWHTLPVDSAWMRDNGPVYVLVQGTLAVQDWKFDAWGGNFGTDVPFENDDAVPALVAKYLELEVQDQSGYVLERGNLELNGADTLVLNWDCQDDRNPGLTAAQHEKVLSDAFGVTRIIWAYGHDPLDGTTGHIDGTARFISADTIAIGNNGTATDEDLAVACEQAGLHVVRFDGDSNWLVGNGFVLAGAEGDPALDEAFEAQLSAFFPGRDVHLVDVVSIWDSGGGVHCVTNDQPAGP